jgi:hypothetical protein
MRGRKVHLHWFKGSAECRIAGLLSCQDIPVPRVGELFDFAESPREPFGTFKVVQVRYSFDHTQHLESVWVQLEYAPEEALEYGGEEASGRGRG